MLKKHHPLSPVWDQKCTHPYQQSPVSNLGGLMHCMTPRIVRHQYRYVLPHRKQNQTDIKVQKIYVTRHVKGKSDLKCNFYQ